MGEKVLSFVQFGKETTHGTAVAADTILLFTLDAGDADREVHLPKVDYGGRMQGHAKNSTMKMVGVNSTLDDADGLYYEALPIMLNMCLIGAQTGTEQTTSQSDYLYTFTAPNTGAETVDTGTFEFGDDNQAYEFAYGLGTDMTISGDAASGEVHGKMTVVGDRRIQTTKTAALTVPDVEFMDAKLSRLYIDSTWASLGSTELTDALVSWEFHLMGGVHAKRLGGSTRLITSHNQGEIDATLTLTVERNAAVKAEELIALPASTYASTMRAVRLTVTGTLIGSTKSHSLTIDMTGVYTNWQPMGGETDGNLHDVITIGLAKDDTASSDTLEILISTSTTAI